MPQVFNEREAKDVIALEWLLKNANIYKFDKKAQAMKFQVYCMGAIPYKLGVDLGGVPGHMVVEYLGAHGIYIQPKRYPLPDDYWRDGYYYYRNDELLYFVSRAMKENSVQQGGTIQIDNPQWVVRTNYKA